MAKMKDKVQIIRWFTPLLGMALITLVSLKGPSFGALESFGWEDRDTFVLLLILFSLFLGNFYCGWLCFGGLIQKVLYLISTKVFKEKRLAKVRISGKVHSYMKYLRYLLLAAWFVSILLTGAGLLEPEVASFIKTSLIGMLFLISIPFAFMTERFFCRYFCINGALYGLLNRISLKKKYRNKELCLGCGNCDAACPAGIMVSRRETINDLACINCMKCFKACPQEGALTFGKKK